uniref:CSON003781 protein n=1 Tax=Culicoides sonorensis TaxID=179676 RepID=A0A336LDD6_CULSO
MKKSLNVIFELNKIYHKKLSVRTGFFMFNHHRGMKRNLSVSPVKKQFRMKSDTISVENGIKFLGTPVKSESDKKEYRLIQLSNGLKALLIDSRNVISHATSESEDDESDDESQGENSDVEDESCTEETLAACSLMIDVGSFSDPPEIQGLAHFLEHMIFMGSEKYPIENDFDQFINKCGGSSNADTDCEETSFYFEVTETHLDEALDRFSQLFIAPLMSRNAMEREKQAVDSEFQQKINIDESRREQLLAELGNKNHPCSSFTWGNFKTLRENIDNDTLYKKTHEFRKRHYSGHRMYVALQARKDLDSLQALVERYFSEIPSNHLPGVDFTKFTNENAFQADFHEKIYYAKSKSDINKLDITWCLPSIMGKYKAKSDEYVSFLIGHEGKGSLCSYLRRNLLALEVRAGIDFSGFEHNSMYSIFMINIVLTDYGLGNIEKVLVPVFSYLKLLEESPVSEDLFKELQQIEENSFKFQTEKQAIDNVEEFVVNIKYYEPVDILTGPSLYFEFNENDILKLISNLNQRTFNLMISSNKPIPDIDYKFKEKWFGTEYGTKSFPSEWTQLWENRQILPQLFLPEKNEFVPSNFEILPLNSENTECPQKLIDDDTLQLWYRQDDKFLLPHSHIYFYFMNSIVQKSPADACKLNLFSLVLRYYLVEALYPATMTGIGYQCYSAELGYVIKVYGFNEKLHKIIDIIMKYATTIDQIMEENVVQVMKTQLLKNYHNTFIKPGALSRELRLMTIQEYFHPSYIKYNHLLNTEFDDLKKFIPKFMSNMKIQCLIQGNTAPDQARRIGESVLKALSTNVLETPIETCAKQIPIGSNYICVKSLRDLDSNSTVTNYYQVGKSSIRLTAILDMLVSLVEEPLFDILRTKEQLGYEVSMSVRDTFGILGLTITVKNQENKFSSMTVDKRIEEFCNEIINILTNMSSDDFETARDSLIKLKALPDTELKEEVQRNWTEITEEEHIFDRRFREIEHLKQVSQKELIEFYTDLINDKNKRKLSIQVMGDDKIGEISESDDIMQKDEAHRPVQIEYRSCYDTAINDLDTFKNSLKTFPVVKTLLD